MPGESEIVVPASPAAAPAAAPAPAPASPAKPAPAAPVSPAAPATPAAEPAPPSTHDATLDLKAKLSAGKSIDDVIAEGDEKPPVAAPAATAEGEGEEAKPGEGEGAEEPVKPEGAEGAEGAEGDEALDPALVVELPVRREGDEPLKLALDSPEAVERFNQLANEAATGREAQRVFEAVRRKEAERQQFELGLKLDPVGFITSGLHPQLQKDVTLQLLADPKIWDAIAPDVEALLDPAAREVFQAKQEAQRYKTRDALKGSYERQQANETNARELSMAVSALVPEGYSNEQASLFLRDALNDLSRYSNERKVEHIDPRDVPVLLAARLTAVGVNPAAAAGRLAALIANGYKAPTPAKGAGRPGAPAKPVQKPVVTAASLKASADAKRRAAAAAPAGAGMPGGVPTAPPAKASLKDATKHARTLLSTRS